MWGRTRLPERARARPCVVGTSGLEFKDSFVITDQKAIVVFDTACTNVPSFELYTICGLKIMNKPATVVVDEGGMFSGDVGVTELKVRSGGGATDQEFFGLHGVAHAGEIECKLRAVFGRSFFLGCLVFAIIFRIDGLAGYGVDDAPLFVADDF